MSPSSNDAVNGRAPPSDVRLSTGSCRPIPTDPCQRRAPPQITRANPGETQSAPPQISRATSMNIFRDPFFSPARIAPPPPTPWDVADDAAYSWKGLKLGPPGYRPKWNAQAAKARREVQTFVAMACDTSVPWERTWCPLVLAAWRRWEKAYGMTPMAPWDFAWHMKHLGFKKPYVPTKSIKGPVFTGISLLPEEASRAATPVNPPSAAPQAPHDDDVDDIDLDAIAAGIR